MTKYDAIKRAAKTPGEAAREANDRSPYTPNHRAHWDRVARAAIETFIAQMSTKDDETIKAALDVMAKLLSDES